MNIGISENIAIITNLIILNACLDFFSHHGLSLLIADMV